MNIPKDIKDLIYKYKHNLLMKEICNEIKKSFYFCIYCQIMKNNIISPFFLHCSKCNSKICFNCCSSLKYIDISKNNCLKCFAKDLYIKQIERILNRKLEIIENKRYLLLINNLIDYEILDTMRFLKHIQKGIYNDFEKLYNHISVFIISEFNLNRYIIMDLYNQEMI